ncbi:hypothetical protein BDN70DRAFT_435944 [Pholiota conissans]|uniref:Uncharacterized protein n=1 Tax=Pholiota conissans TaxID=109636 RepID=A0A9P5Z6J3_9AGAR|nr:hypothetical protein BDN70DRAFT_435944 [Pholiota conissans]
MEKHFLLYLAFTFSSGMWDLRGSMQREYVPVSGLTSSRIPPLASCPCPQWLTMGFENFVCVYFFSRKTGIIAVPSDHLLCKTKQQCTN